MRLIHCIVVLLLGVGSLYAQNNEEFIFAPLSSGKALAGTQPDNHASTLVELSNGDVMAAWFGGTWEGAPDVAIYAARQHAGVWSAPRELVRVEHIACWNPVLFHDQKGRLWLYYKVGKSPSTWTGARKWSDDEGLTWSAEEALAKGTLGPIKDKPLVLNDGTIVSGSSVENETWAAWIERSSDNGKTWTIPNALDIPDAGALDAMREGKHVIHDARAGVDTKITPPDAKTVGVIQPTVVLLGAHHLRFYARSRTRAARIAIADSLDDGKTWTQARYIDLPNPNSGIDAVRLKDGRVVLIFNNSYNKRSPLNLAVSADGEYFNVFKRWTKALDSTRIPRLCKPRMATC
jgi:predicted neuraminidase